MFRRFHGGIVPPDKKHATRHKQIESLDPPPFIILPMLMHSGHPVEPAVRIGEHVNLGQLVARSDSPESAPLHSSVSGTVKAIGPMPHPDGTECLSVVIENDGKDSLDPGISPFGSVESLSGEQLFKIISDCGIVGQGSESASTALKLTQALGKVRHLIINGCESEPYLTTDHRLMLEYTEEVIGGTRALMKILGLQSAVIAVESNKRDAAVRLAETLPSRSSISIRLLRARYPQGLERMLVKSVTGRTVPRGKASPDVGCAVFNVSTAVAAHKAITTGMPLVSRVVTVAGSAVSNSKNLSVRLGTPITTVFDATGGFRETPQKIIVGGPMTGLALHTLNVPVIKNTTGLLAFTQTEVRDMTGTACIRCGRCVKVCPMKLIPASIYMYQQNDMLDKCFRLRADDCMECGACAYICPARLQLVQSIRAAKSRIC